MAYATTTEVAIDQEYVDMLNFGEWGRSELGGGVTQGPG